MELLEARHLSLLREYRWADETYQGVRELDSIVCAAMVGYVEEWAGRVLGDDADICALDFEEDGQLSVTKTSWTPDGLDTFASLRTCPEPFRSGHPLVAHLLGVAELGLRVDFSFEGLLINLGRRRAEQMLEPLLAGLASRGYEPSTLGGELYMQTCVRFDAEAISALREAGPAAQATAFAPLTAVLEEWRTHLPEIELFVQRGAAFVRSGGRPAD